MTFEFAGSRPIKAEDEYRSGLSVGFVPMLGAKRMQPVSVDLVVDEVPLEGAERISPADRIEVDGLETCDYLVEAALADKLCGIVEQHGERASSRVKDLVDIAVYATTAAVDGTRLQSRLRREASLLGRLLRIAEGLGRSPGAPVREALPGDGSSGGAEEHRSRIRAPREAPRPRNQGRSGWLALESGSARVGLSAVCPDGRLDDALAVG